MTAEADPEEDDVAVSPGLNGLDVEVGIGGKPTVELRPDGIDAAMRAHSSGSGQRLECARGMLNDVIEVAVGKRRHAYTRLWNAPSTWSSMS